MADPVIHYTFDTDGTNSGTLGSANNLTIPSDFSIDSENLLLGSGCLKVINSTNTLTNTQTTFPDWDTPAGGFTISLWAKLEYTTNMRLFEFYTPGPVKFRIHWSSQNELRVGKENEHGGLPYGTNIFDNQYHHLVITFITSGVGLYIDNVYEGTMGASPSFTNYYLDKTMSEFYLGGDGDDVAYTAEGYIDNFRIHDYILTTAQINTLYIEGALYVQPVIHYTFDTDGTNSGTLAPLHNLNIPSGFSTSESAKLIGAKGLIAGDSQYAIYSGQSMYQTSMDTWWTTSNEFTISLWAYFKNGWFDDMRLFMFGWPSTQWTSVWFPSKTTLSMYYGASTENVTIPDMFTNPSWHNFVFTFVVSGSRVYVKVYIDSVLYDSHYSYRSFNNKLIDIFRIGTSNNYPVLNGYVDDLRIYDYEVDATLMDYIYKVGSNTNVASLSGARMLNLQNVGATLSQLIAAGFTSAHLIAVGGFTITQLIAEGVTIAQLLAGGVTIADLLANGVTAAELLAENVTIAVLLAENVTIADLLAENVTIAVLLAAGVTIAQLLAENVNIADLLANGVTAAELLAENITVTQLLAAGVSIVEILALGIVLDWNLDTDANHFDQSYVKGFMDLSGSVMIRNDNKLITNADLFLGGNLTVQGTTLFPDSMTLKSHLFMGEDISANGNLYVGGDLSVNGQFSGNFANGIIPTTAISGSAIEITGNVLFTGDVSFNGPTVDVTNLLPVNQIEFNDATTMSTYDDNILSGTFAGADVVFKDSTFTSVICEGAATAQSTVTSDYRIKENVTELNETDTVDALVPIQYNNTLSGNHEFGLLAHELQEIYPDLVNGEKDGVDYQQVHYNGLIGVLVKEVQDLKQRLAVLNNR